MSSLQISSPASVSQYIDSRFQIIQRNLDEFLCRRLDTSSDAYQSHALRYALGHPSTFVHILLPTLLSTSGDPTFNHTSTLTRDDSKNIYSRFVSHVLRSPSESPSLDQIFDVQQSRKKELKRFRRNIIHRKAFNTVYIHRVRSSVTPDVATGKIVVIDSPDLQRFPSSSYHHMNSDRCYIVDRVGTKPQIHIIVLDNLAPSDDEIRDILKQSTKKDITSKEWCHNIVAYNLFSKLHDIKLRDFGRSASDNVRHRRQIRRPGLGGAVGIGPRPDQAGNMGEYRNILQGDSLQKFELIDSADEIFDYFIEVSFHFLTYS
jgi:hypothetical protein